MKKTDIPLDNTAKYRDAYSPLDKYASPLIMAELLLIVFVFVEVASRILGFDVAGPVHAWLALGLFWLPLFYLAGFVLVVTVDSRWKFVALAVWILIGLAGAAVLIAAGVGAL